MVNKGVDSYRTDAPCAATASLAPLEELTKGEADAFVRQLESSPFTANALDESEEMHRRLLGPLYDPRHKWPIVHPGVIDMRLFERSKMVPVAVLGEDLDEMPDDTTSSVDDVGGWMRPPARKLDELLRQGSGTSVFAFVVSSPREQATTTTH